MQVKNIADSIKLFGNRVGLLTLLRIADVGNMSNEDMKIMFLLRFNFV